MKNSRQIVAALISLFLLAACTDRAGDAADRAKADAERAREAFSKAHLVSVSDLIQNNKNDTATLDTSSLAAKMFADGAEIFADRAFAALQKAEVAARKAGHAAENGLTDRAVESAFDASEAAIAAEEARDGAIAACRSLLELVGKTGDQPNPCQ